MEENEGGSGSSGEQNIIHNSVMSDLVPQATTDEQAVALWLHGRPANTHRAYRSDISRFFSFVQKPVATVSLSELQAFQDSLEGSAGTRKRVLTAVKSFLSFCQRIGYIRYNVGTVLRLQKVKNTIAERILSEDVVQSILAGSRDLRERAILTFLYVSGVRESELRSMRWKDLQPREKGRAQVTIFGKGSKTRFILLSEELYTMLRELDNTRDPESFVFGSMSQSTLWRLVKKASARVGLKASPHWFRHSCASHSLDAGAPIGLVQQQLGHEDLSTTGVYLHVRPGAGLFEYLKPQKEEHDIPKST